MKRNAFNNIKPVYHALYALGKQLKKAWHSLLKSKKKAIVLSLLHT